MAHDTDGHRDDGLQQGLQRGADSGAPLEEVGADGPSIEASVREAMESLTARPGRDAAGRYVAGNSAAVKAGERSELLWAALAPAKRDLVERVKSDLGVDGDAPQTLSGLVEGYVEARLFRQSMFVRLVDLGGAVTNKGKARALYTAYLAALDRETKLAQLLGFERRARHLPSSPAEAARQATARHQTPEGE